MDEPIDPLPLLMPIALLGYALTQFARRSYDLWGGFASRAWPRAAGVIVASRFEEYDAVTTARTVIPSAVEVSIRYEYDVPHGRNTGRRVRMTPLGPRAARRAAERYRVGTKVVVAYHPTKPRRAVLEPGVTPLGVGLLLHAIAIAAVAVIWLRAIVRPGS